MMVLHALDKKYAVSVIYLLVILNAPAVGKDMTKKVTDLIILQWRNAVEERRLILGPDLDIGGK
jgi:hypothetical protein